MGENLNRAVAARSHRGLGDLEPVVGPDTVIVLVLWCDASRREELDVVAVGDVITDRRPGSEPGARPPVVRQPGGEPFEALTRQLREKLGRGVIPAIHHGRRVGRGLRTAGDGQHAVVVLDEPGVAGDIPDRGAEVGVVGDVGPEIGAYAPPFQGIGPDLVVGHGSDRVADRVFLDLRQAKDAVLILVSGGDEVGGELVAARHAGPVLLAQAGLERRECWPSPEAYT